MVIFDNGLLLGGTLYILLMLNCWLVSATCDDLYINHFCFICAGLLRCWREISSS